MKMPKGNTTKNKPQTGTLQPQETVTMERPAHIDDGTAARGTVNSRANQTRTQPEPEAAVSAIHEEAAAKVVAMRPAKGSRTDYFEQRDVEISDAIANKVQQLSEARQRLAEAADLYREGDSKSAEAKEAADKASVLLYRARVNGTVSADELSAVLGDQFGFKAKQNGEPSKTPNGQGEAIRKRIVRAVQAHEHVNGGDGGRFFQGLPEDEVQDVLTNMESGDIGFWAAYERFAEIKRDHAVKVNPAFDPKRIAAIAEALQEEGAAKTIRANKALADAYVGLRKMIALVGQEIAALDKKAA
jgi:hypothetical protein